MQFKELCRKIAPPGRSQLRSAGRVKPNRAGPARGVMSLMRNNSYAELRNAAMNHETLLLTCPSVAACAAGSNHETARSRRLVQVQPHSSPAAQNGNDYSPAQEVEVFEEMPGNFVQINPKLRQLASAINITELGRCFEPLVRFLARR